MISVALVAAVLVLLGGLSVLVYRDARRVGVPWPPLWAFLIYATGMLGLGLFLFVPTIPIPGLLVIVLIGPIFYLFERDDAIHGEETADPHTMADAETTRSGSVETDSEPQSEESGEATDSPSARETDSDDTAPPR